MSETQEKVWVVMRRTIYSKDGQPVKVFDDRQDAREYAKRRRQASPTYSYAVVGVKKG